MKKKLKNNKKTIKNLKLKLKKVNNRKAAPLFAYSDDFAPTNGSSC
jgi:hypothetical protein